MKKLINKYDRGGLANHPYSGTWGNRGQGNELQSALENGLSGIWKGFKWLNDKTGDYIELGLANIIGLIPIGMPKEEFVQNIKNKQQAINEGLPVYFKTNGDYELIPMIGTPPLPVLIKNPSKEVLDVYNRMKKLRNSYAVRESLLRKAGQLDRMPSTATAKRYKELETLYNKLTSKPVKVTLEQPILTKKLNAEFKHSKSMATGDGRATNLGRPVMRERQYDEVERMMRKDPKAAAIVQRYDRKVAQGMDYHYLRQARIKMILDYVKANPGFFDWLLK